ncbi:MAG: class B sortase [Clostridia bacterium]|nr:class B sortase [Clostridia bacterium]
MGSKRYDGKAAGKRQLRERLGRPALSYTVLAICCLGLALACVRLIRYGQSAAGRSRTNQALQALHAEVEEGETSQEKASILAEDTPLPAEEDAANGMETQPALTPEPIAFRAEYQALGGELLPEMARLRETNGDLVAWLRIPGLVDLPVVYSGDNRYMDIDFYGRPDNGGTLFLDALHPLAAGTQHLIVHGHNMKDGSMFGLLSHYRQAGYAARHSAVYFSTLYRREEYRVFCVAQVSIDPYASSYVQYVGHPTFRDEEQLDLWLGELRKNALYWAETPTPADALLTLSTCIGDDRLLVMCRRVGEPDPEAAQA